MLHGLALLAYTVNDLLVLLLGVLYRYMLINLRPLLECQGKVYYYEDPPMHRCDVWFSRSTSSVLCRSAARSDHSDECLAVLPPHMQPGVVEEEGVRRVEPPCHPLGEHLAPHRRTLEHQRVSPPAATPPPAGGGGSTPW